ncbi:MAG TPA: ATP synthase F1 subunit delta [Solirubrobacteraceae bacterium]|jgi:F-type H+-transporting ATPase subunit delta|nr:ATP synthase F1 subunit delta [Solirubrobacteraceae bacterium]
MEELAQVYGRAFFEVAQEQGKLDLLREQLGQFADAVSENRDLELFFFSPYFSTAEKQEALGKLLDGADERLLSFLSLLIENHRMPVIFRIRREYDRLWEDEKKLLPVVLTSAVALDEQTIADLGARIGERTGRTVELTAEVQPDILGGIVVRVGNSILDASIRNRLEQLRAHVASGVA